MKIAVAGTGYVGLSLAKIALTSFRALFILQNNR